MRKPLMAVLAILATIAVVGSGIAFAGTMNRHHRPWPGHPRPHPSPSASPSASPSPSPSPSDTPTDPGKPPTGGGSCALPKFPDAGCTGVPAGTALTVVNGNQVIDKPGTVIDGKDIRGCVTVNAPGVTIRRSKVSCRSSIVIGSFDGVYTGAGLTIEDTEVSCLGTNGTGIGDTNFTATRVNVHDCENGFDLDQLVRIQDSYLHNLFNSPESHTDGIQLSSHYQLAGGKYSRDASGRPVVIPNAVNITIRHNTIYDYNTADHQDGTSAIISNRGSDTNVLIQDNLMAGGAYTLYCDGGTGTNYRVINNHFSMQFHAKVGFYGATTGCSDETYTGNVIHETGKPVAGE